MTATALPVMDGWIVDIRLRELRSIDSPLTSLSFQNLTEPAKARVRAIRAEFGTNEYIPSLDD